MSQALAAQASQQGTNRLFHLSFAGGNPPKGSGQPTVPGQMQSQVQGQMPPQMPSQMTGNYRNPSNMFNISGISDIESFISTGSSAAGQQESVLAPNKLMGSPFPSQEDPLFQFGNSVMPQV